MCKLGEALNAENDQYSAQMNLVDVGCTLGLSYIIDLGCGLLHMHRALSLR